MVFHKAGMENLALDNVWSLPENWRNSIVIKDMQNFLIAFFLLVTSVLVPQILIQKMDNRSKATDLAAGIIDPTLIKEGNFRFELSDEYLTVDCPAVGGCFKNLHVKVFNAGTEPVYGAAIALQGNWTNYTQAGDVVDTNNKQMYFKGVIAAGGLLYEGDLTATRYSQNTNTEYEIFSVMPMDCRNGGVLNGCMPIDGVSASSFTVKFLTTLPTATPTLTPVSPTPTLTPDFLNGPFNVRVGTTDYMVCAQSDVNCRLQSSLFFANKSNVPIYMPKFWKVGKGTYMDGNGQTVDEMDSSIHPASTRSVITPDGDGVSTVITILNPGVIGTYGGTIYAGGQYCTSLSPTPSNCSTPPATQKSYTLQVIADEITPVPTVTVGTTVVPTMTQVPTATPTLTPAPTLVPTLTPSPTVAPTPTSIPTAVVVQQQFSSSSSSNNSSSSGSSGGGGSSSSGGGGCGDSFPWGVPYITAITAGNNWARVTFNGKANPVNQYRVWYGELKNKRAFNTVVSSSSSGSVATVVSGLKANTRYYFATQPVNGCKDGVVGAEWYNTTTKTAKQNRTVSRKEPVIKAVKKK